VRNHTSHLLLAVACLFGVFATATAANRPTEFSSSSLHPRSGIKFPVPARVSALGTYHNGATLRCADCHVMHQSKQHRLEDDPANDPFGGFPQNFSGGANLLKSPDPVALCLACHDGQSGIPDVMGNDVNALTERSAGFFAAVGERNPRGHSLDYGLVTGDFELCMRCHFGGDFTTASATCIDCHNPHGNGRVRNLQWASYPGGEPQFGLLEATSSGLQKYEAANIAYGTDNTDALREVSNMCIDCHHVFSGDSYIDPDGNGWHNRHPSYESERGSTNSIAQGGARGTTDPAHWESGSGAGFGATARMRWMANGATNFADAMIVDAASNGVFCLSCHQAHGNDHSFALRWDPTTTPAGFGCEQCHNRTGL
jgi:hypothetical protein